MTPDEHRRAIRKLWDWQSNPDLFRMADAIETLIQHVAELDRRLKQLEQERDPEPQPADP